MEIPTIIEFIRWDDWEELRVNGEVVAATHQIDAEELLTALNIPFTFRDGIEEDIEPSP